MPADLDSILWPIAKLSEALDALVRRSGLEADHAASEAPPPPDHDAETLDVWIASYARRIGLEAEQIETPYPEAEALIRRAGPALFLTPGDDGPRLLAVQRARGRTMYIVGPDLKTHRQPLEAVRVLLCESLEAPLIPQIDQMLTETEVPLGRHPRARAALLRERLRGARVGPGWLLRPGPGMDLRRQARWAGLSRQMLALAGAHVLQYVLFLLSWYMIGRGALQGHLETGWIVAWMLLLLTLVPLRMLVTWLQGTFAIRAGSLLKWRLLYGTLRLDPDEMRRQGAGQHFSRVIESEALESLALSGGIIAIVACIELLLALGVLSLGAGGLLHAVLLVAWLIGTLLLGRHYLKQRKRWTETRLHLTHDLIERMVGHRTRLAQEAPDRWHAGEDQAVSNYLEVSVQMDRAAVWLQALVPRGWLVVGLIGLAPAFIVGGGAPGAIAVSLGGMLLAFLAFGKIAAGLLHLADAFIAWQQIKPLFDAAAKPVRSGLPGIMPATDSAPSDGAMLEAHDLVFRYHERGAPVLQNCSVTIHTGDRVLLEGPSGSGKSTLAALLTGLRAPESGLLLLHGLDQQTLGDQAWRSRVAAAPQFHENHVMTETFAFNLLMGRRWPPTPDDLNEAIEICHELGLGPLLARMPGGLQQMVGETGWQLSHGERSRLFIARALLQKADVIVLDESFAALDPENMQLAMRCVLNRAPALVVIAHP